MRKAMLLSPARGVPARHEPVPACPRGHRPTVGAGFQVARSQLQRGWGRHQPWRPIRVLSTQAPLRPVLRNQGLSNPMPPAPLAPGPAERRQGCPVSLAGGNRRMPILLAPLVAARLVAARLCGPGWVAEPHWGPSCHAARRLRPLRSDGIPMLPTLPGRQCDSAAAARQGPGPLRDQQRSLRCALLPQVLLQPRPCSRGSRHPFLQRQSRRRCPGWRPCCPEGPAARRAAPGSLGGGHQGLMPPAMPTAGVSP